MPRGRLSATLFLISGLTAGVACTGAMSHAPKKALPHAGADDDDGTGMLARWSRGQAGGGGCPAGQNCGQQGGYGEDYYGEDSNGGYYSGGYYGGSYGASLYGYGYNPYRNPYPPYQAPPSPVSAGYTITTVHNPGVIEGTITWKNAPKAPASIAAFKNDAKKCGALDNPTLEISSSTKGVANTVVYLADVKLGKQTALLGGTLEEKGCAWSPHVQIAAPIGITLQVVNRASQATSVTIRRTGAQKEVVRDLALPASGQRDVLLDQAGTYQVVADKDHPASTAWIMVPGTPYYVVSDADGYFRLDDVPAGEYTLVAWHEPVATGVDGTGALVMSPPVEVKMHVKVTASGTVTQNLDLGTTIK